MDIAHPCWAGALPNSLSPKLPMAGGDGSSYFLLDEVPRSIWLISTRYIQQWAGDDHPCCIRRYDGQALPLRWAVPMPANWKRPPTEGGLPRLLRVKCGLLSLHPLYQFLDPIKRSLIGDSGRQASIILDFLVKFDALLTHCSSGFPCYRSINRCL